MGEGLELTEEQLTKIINSKKTFGFNKYDKDNKLIYSWVLSGEVLGTVGKFNLNVVDKLEDGEDFKKAFNYADGVFLDFSDCIEIPNGALFKYFVNDKYSEETGLLYCIIKKLSTNSLDKLFDEWLPIQKQLVKGPIHMTLKDVRKNNK